MGRTNIKTKAKSKTKANTDVSFHPYSISIAVKTEEELDELIRLCKEHELYYTVHDYDE
jgi:FAD/FMN-containing dehydrogenase